MTYQLTWWTEDEYPEFPNTTFFDIYEEMVAYMGELDAYKSEISICVPEWQQIDVHETEMAHYMVNLNMLVPKNLGERGLAVMFMMMVKNHIGPKEAERMFEQCSLMCGKLAAMVEETPTETRH